MSEKEVEEKIVQKAHWIAQKFKEKGLDELTAYIAFEFDYDEYLIFKRNQDKLLRLFLKTIEEDLQSLNE